MRFWERFKAWLQMRKIVPRGYRCSSCSPFCPHVEYCLGDFKANMEETKDCIREKLDEVM